MNSSSSRDQLVVLERGHVYFIYVPKVGYGQAKQLQDVQRTFMVLAPEEYTCFRVIILGRKTMPKPYESGKNHWGFVELVSSDSHEIEKYFDQEDYETKTRGSRHREEGRALADGAYILCSAGSTFFCYRLHQPVKRGSVQSEFHLENQACYVLSIKNPELESPQGKGLEKSQKAHYSPSLQSKFEGRHFAPVFTEMLNYKGCELLFTSLAKDIGDVDKLLKKGASSADSFDELAWPTSRPAKPLFQGTWQ